MLTDTVNSKGGREDRDMCLMGNCSPHKILIGSTIVQLCNRYFSLGCKRGIYLYTRGVVQCIGRVGAYDIWSDMGIGIPCKVYLGSTI